MPLLYILISEGGTHYIGSTVDIERRLQEHNSQNGKKSRFTNRYKNWKILYTEPYATIEEAKKREMEIKSWKGGNKFKQLLEQSH